MTRLQVELPGLSLKNPLMPASGSVYYALDDYGYDLNALGAIVLKTVTPQPRSGNARPWVKDLPHSVMNSVGLANPGIDVVADEILPAVHAKFPDMPIMPSIAGDTVDDYVLLAQRLADKAYVSALEVNLSCPNTANGGMEFGVDPQTAAEVITRIRAVTDKPLYAKLSPNVTDIKPIALAVESAGAAGLVLINTVVGMTIDLEQRAPVFARKMAGISGRAVHEIAVRFIYEAASVVNIPIIGVGGVYTIKDALELMMAGASAVQVWSATRENPLVLPEILAAMPQTLTMLGFENVTEVTHALK